MKNSQPFIFEGKGEYNEIIEGKNKRAVTIKDIMNFIQKGA